MSKTQTKTSEKMTARSLRVSDELWEAAKDKAAEQDVPLSEVIRDALSSFVVTPLTPGDEKLLCMYEDCDAEATHQQGDGTYCEMHAEMLDDAEPEDKPGEFSEEGGDCGCSHSTEEAAADAASQASEELEFEGVIPLNDPMLPTSAAIYGYGRLSESEDPETQAAVIRVKELFAEGAVGVSILHDSDPDTMPAPEELEALETSGQFEALEQRMAMVKSRPRHVAVVDTPAFSNARPKIDEDGNISGPITYEGQWTGDNRWLTYGQLVWDEELLPIPIIWDRQDGDHTGMTVGYIDRLERVDGETSPRISDQIVEEDVEAIVASMGTSQAALPAKMFSKFKATKAMPLHIDEPDANGLRRVWGHVVPNGVCHRSNMGACFQYPVDVDKNLSSFHTGFEMTLDDGTSFRPGALTYGGMHVDTALARQGVGIRELNRHREDSRNVFAMVRAWPDSFGLAVSGVLAANISDNDLLQVLSCSPSVELWPSMRGRTLVGAHIVPTPAWPVVSSMGDVMEFVSPISIVADGLEYEQEPEEPNADAYNWVDDVGGLPKYIKRIEKHLMEKGFSESHAIATAVNAVKKMCSTGDVNFPGKQDVNLGSRAEACAAAAEWEEKKARAKATSLEFVEELKSKLEGNEEPETLDLDEEDGDVIKPQMPTDNQVIESLARIEKALAQLIAEATDVELPEEDEDEDEEDPVNASMNAFVTIDDNGKWHGSDDGKFVEMPDITFGKLIELVNRVYDEQQDPEVDIKEALHNLPEIQESAALDLRERDYEAVNVEVGIVLDDFPFDDYGDEGKVLKADLERFQKAAEEYIDDKIESEGPQDVEFSDGEQKLIDSLLNDGHHWERAPEGSVSYGKWALIDTDGNVAAAVNSDGTLEVSDWVEIPKEAEDSFLPADFNPTETDPKDLSDEQLKQAITVSSAQMDPTNSIELLKVWSPYWQEATNRDLLGDLENDDSDPLEEVDAEPYSSEYPEGVEPSPDEEDAGETERKRKGEPDPGEAPVTPEEVPNDVVPDDSEPGGDASTEEFPKRPIPDADVAPIIANLSDDPEIQNFADEIEADIMNDEPDKARTKIADFLADPLTAAADLSEEDRARLQKFADGESSEKVSVEEDTEAESEDPTTADLEAGSVNEADIRVIDDLLNSGMSWQKDDNGGWVVVDPNGKVAAHISEPDEDGYIGVPEFEDWIYDDGGPLDKSEDSGDSDPEFNKIQKQHGKDVAQLWADLKDRGIDVDPERLVDAIEYYGDVDSALIEILEKGGYGLQSPADEMAAHLSKLIGLYGGDVDPKVLSKTFKKKFDPTKHKRGSKGTPEGGRFVPKDGSKSKSKSKNKKKAKKQAEEAEEATQKAAKWRKKRTEILPYLEKAESVLNDLDGPELTSEARQLIKKIARTIANAKQRNEGDPLDDRTVREQSGNLKKMLSNFLDETGKDLQPSQRKVLEQTRDAIEDVYSD